MNQLYTSPMSEASEATERTLRSDGAEARQRLLLAALKLFAQKGFARTSTRDIAEAAQVNLGAIRYYFGDKQGLYRAAFNEPMGCASAQLAQLTAPVPSLREMLAQLFHSFTDPLKQGELARLCTRLHLREMIEPTGAMADEISNGIAPCQAALVQTLCDHFVLATPDDAIRRLAFAIVSLPVFLYMASDVIDAISPALLATPAAIDAWSLQMVNQAEALIADEARRRGLTQPLAT